MLFLSSCIFVVGNCYYISCFLPAIGFGVRVSNGDYDRRSGNTMFWLWQGIGRKCAGKCYKFLILKFEMLFYIFFYMLESRSMIKWKPPGLYEFSRRTSFTLELGLRSGLKLTGLCIGYVVLAKL